MMLRTAFRPVIALALLAALDATGPCLAQGDTTQARVDTGVPAVRKPPLSAKRAFLGSLILPGYSQSVLGRQRSGAMILAFETVAILMVRESSLALREARRHSMDSVLVSYTDATGTPVPQYARGFTPALIRARKEQREDWTSVLIATHLFAALDALVASVLWDLPAEVGVSGSAAQLGLRLNW